MKILHYPHPVLRYKCKAVQRINQKLRDIAAEMFDTMYANDGVGLAANQAGLPLQMFVMNAAGDREKTQEEYVFINPVILKKNGNATDNEGCLSFPEIHADVVRAEMIDVEAVSLSGEVYRFQWKGRPARIVQHEIDHLLGIGFTDRLSVGASAAVSEGLEELRSVFESERRVGAVKDNAAIFKELEEWERKYC
ncbi:MAG: peptide deformylase [Planctomycetaceae bacterium]|nr:peptide deformylase [Planctomycetaceae bacterium]